MEEKEYTVTVSIGLAAEDPVDAAQYAFRTMSDPTWWEEIILPYGKFVVEAEDGTEIAVVRKEGQWVEEVT